MNNLTQEEKDVVLDFYFRCGDDERIRKGRDLIASDSGAAELYASLEQTLGQMDQVKYEPCPDNLVDITIARLNLAVSAEKVRNEDPLQSAGGENENYSNKVYTGKKWWNNISDLAAVAAVLLAVMSFAFPSLGKMRQLARQNECQSRQRNIAAGISGFVNDNGSLLSSIGETEDGTRAWKNSYPWELVKGGYVKPDNFLCPGRKDGQKIDIPEADYAKYDDFPSRRNMTYSFVVHCRVRANKPLSANDALLVDRNPVFEEYDINKNQNGKLSITDQMTKIMSTNHGGRGQNLLLGDGSVTFMRGRYHMGDDIFTIRGKLIYDLLRGEVPCDENDIFLAP
ncbi:MAG: hypothetical protein KAS23_14835 [Anaerohalosphaera sp.]|nr:hypothetical protein [Anaerohalosphaera sp.]